MFVSFKYLGFVLGGPVIHMIHIIWTHPYFNCIHLYSFIKKFKRLRNFHRKRWGTNARRSKYTYEKARWYGRRVSHEVNNPSSSSDSLTGRGMDGSEFYTRQHWPTCNKILYYIVVLHICHTPLWFNITCFTFCLKDIK